MQSEEEYEGESDAITLLRQREDGRMMEGTEGLMEGKKKGQSQVNGSSDMS